MDGRSSMLPSAHFTFTVVAVLGVSSWETEYVKT